MVCMYVCGAFHEYLTPCACLMIVGIFSEEDIFEAQCWETLSVLWPTERFTFKLRLYNYNIKISILLSLLSSQRSHPLSHDHLLE